MKKAISLILSLALICALAVPALAADSDFTIEDGILTGYSGPGGDIVIPSGVTKIAAYVFSSNDKLTSVTIPKGVTALGEGCFGGCTNLVSVTIPDSVTSIGGMAFYNCEKLTSINLPKSVTAIDGNAFTGTPWLAGLGDFASVNGMLLKYQGTDSVVTIPAGIKTICASAFFGRLNLTSVTIPEGVTEIAGSIVYGGTFAYCKNLKRVAIPKSMKSIGACAFEIDQNLQDVYYAGTEAQWKEIEISPLVNDPLTSANIHYGSTMPAPKPVGGFSDVYDTDYFSDAVLWAVNHDPQITNGVGGGKFGATGTVTRAQAVTFLWRAAGCPDPKTVASPFSDVTDPGAWYYKAVLWAAEQNITNGVGDGKFGLDGTLAYNQMLTFMARAAGADASGDDWSQKALTWAERNSMTDGLIVTVTGDCPRCDVVYFLWKQMA